MPRKKKNSPDYNLVLANDGLAYGWSDKRYVLYTAIEMLVQCSTGLLNKKDADKATEIQNYYVNKGTYYVREKRHNIHSAGNSNIGPTLSNTDKAFYGYVEPEDFADVEKDIKKVIDSFKKAKKTFSDPKYAKIVRSIDDTLDLFDYNKGNYLEALSNVPYINGLFRIFNTAPKIRNEEGKEQWDRIIDSLGPMFDYNMDLQHYICEEFRIQYDRQEYERTGMTSYKEQEYKDRLYANHKKVLENYEKIINAENPDQYTEFLGDPIDDDFLASDPGSRDQVFNYGMLRGECRAIENGWGYKDLPLLGFIGGLEEKYNSFLKNLSEADKEKRKNDLEKLKNDVDTLKKEWWDKKSPTNDEKIALINQINALSADARFHYTIDNSILRIIRGNKESINNLKSEYEKQKDIEKEKEDKLENGLSTLALDHKFKEEGMKAIAEEMIRATRKDAVIMNGQNIGERSERDQAWHDRYMNYASNLTEAMTKTQLSEYFRSLAEIQTDLQYKLGLEAERIEKDIMDGKINVPDEIKNDDLLRSKVATKIAERTTDAGRDLGAVSDLITGYRMEYSDQPLPSEEVRRIGIDGIYTYDKLFSEAYKDAVIDTAVFNSEKIKSVAKKAEGINGLIDDLKKFGISVDDDGKVNVSNKEKLNSEIAKRPAERYSSGIGFKDALSKITSDASKKLTQLSDMNVKPEKDSDEFTNMRLALTAVAALDKKSTPLEIMQSLKDLEYAASEYTRNRTSSSSKRRNAAADLTAFAKSSYNDLAGVNKGNLTADKPLTDDISDMFKNGMEKNILVDDKIPDYVRELKTKVGNLWRDLNNTNINERTDSKQFTAMVKAVDKLNKVSLASTPAEISDALDEVRKTSAQYISKIEIEGGGKLLNGSRRLSAAKSLLDLSAREMKEFDALTNYNVNLNVALNKVYMDYDLIENAPAIGNNIIKDQTNYKELLNDDELENDNKKKKTTKKSKDKKKDKDKDKDKEKNKKKGNTKGKGKGTEEEKEIVIEL